MDRIVSVLGSGWLGLPLVKLLVNEGYTVKASARSTSTYEKLQKENCKVFHIDLQEFDENSTFFNCDYLIFTVPPSAFPSNWQEQLRKILQILRKQNSIIIYTSSTSVYGNPHSLVDENSPLRPDSNSAKKVVDTENLIIESGVNYNILRLGGLVGNNRHPVKYLSGKTSNTGAKHPVNLLHLVDAIAIIHHCIQNKLLDQIFNCCSTEHPIKKEFYSQVAKKAGLEIPIFDDEDNSEGKIVSIEKLLKSNYRFLHPNPFNYPFQ